MVHGSNRRQLKQTLNKFTTLFQKKESNTSTHVLKESSTKVSLSKIKSFFKNGTTEDTTIIDSLPIKHVRFVIFPETTAALSNVGTFQTTQLKERFTRKKPLKSCFKTIKKDLQLSVARQQQTGRKRKIVLNKIQSFFNEKIVPILKPSEEKENMNELKTKLYEKFSKASEAERQLKYIEKLSTEIKSMEQQQIQTKQKYQTTFHALQPRNLERKNQEYERKEIDLQFKKIERDGQLQILQDSISQLRSLEEQVSKLQSQESAILAQKRRETIQKREQKRLQENQRQQQKLEQIKQSALYAWQLNQVRKKFHRQGEHCKLYSDIFPSNPWTVKKELKKEHEEQFRSLRVRYIDLQKRTPKVPRSRGQNIREVASKIPPWKLDQIIKCEGEQLLLLREFEELEYRQRQEVVELKKDTINFFWAFWETKRKQLGMAMHGSEITRQLNIFGKMLRTNTVELYHKLI